MTDEQDRTIKQFSDDYARVVVTPNDPGPALALAHCYNADDQLVREVTVLPSGEILGDTRWPEVPVA